MRRTADTTPRAPAHPIPVFGLYGDAADQPPGGYVHVETIASRASELGWDIGVHRHEALAQCVVVSAGGGVLEVEGEAIGFVAPWFVWIPTATVHGFRFDAGTEGHVLTVSDDMVAASLARSPEGEALAALVLRPAFGEARPQEEIGISMPAVMHAIARELDLPRNGVVAAQQALLMLLLIAVLRLRSLSDLAANLGDRRAVGFRRFREHVERNFRHHASIDDMARSLGMSRAQLYAVTMQATGKSPLQIVHERLIMESKRELIYSTQPIGQIAYALGFSDEAYFSRFFTRRAGMSPSAFRKTRGTSPGALG